MAERAFIYCPICDTNGTSTELVRGNPELHIYRSGQHGFSMMQRNTTSDHWLEELYWWMESYALAQGS